MLQFYENALLLLGSLLLGGGCFSASFAGCLACLPRLFACSSRVGVDVQYKTVTGAVCGAEGREPGDPKGVKSARYVPLHPICSPLCTRQVDADDLPRPLGSEYGIVPKSKERRFINDTAQVMQGALQNEATAKLLSQQPRPNPPSAYVVAGNAVAIAGAGAAVVPTGAGATDTAGAVGSTGTDTGSGAGPGAGAGHCTTTTPAAGCATGTLLLVGSGMHSDSNAAPARRWAAARLELTPSPVPSSSASGTVQPRVDRCADVGYRSAWVWPRCHRREPWALNAAGQWGHCSGLAFEWMRSCTWRGSINRDRDTPTSHLHVDPIIDPHTQAHAQEPSTPYTRKNAGTLQATNNTGSRGSTGPFLSPQQLQVAPHSRSKERTLALISNARLAR